MAVKLHWFLGYSKRTACGIAAYKTSVENEYDTDRNTRIECADDQNKVTCANCQRVAMIGPHNPYRTRVRP